MKDNKLTNYKTAWDFELFYKKGLKDPQIEADVKDIEKICSDFYDKYYSDDKYLTNEPALLVALRDFEDLQEKIGNAKPLFYLSLLLAIESQNTEAEAKSNLLSDRLTKSFNKIVFFELKIGKISEELKNKILKSPDFAKYKYALELLFLQSKHHLTEPEEKILNLKSATSRSMWIDSGEKLLNKQTVKWKGKDIPLSEASFLISTLPTNDRRRMHSLLVGKLKQVSFLSGQEMTAILTDKKVNDELRKYELPYSARALNTQNSIKSIENVVNLVSQNFKTANKFYKLKAKFLGLEKLTYADRAVGIEKTVKKVSFDEAVQLFRKSLEKTDPVFTEIFDRMIKNGQIDVFPKKGKSSVAFCASGIGSPTFVMLNDVETSNSYLTLAHEMGHAFHSELSKKYQPSLYQDYTLSVAEVASTFFENIAFEILEEKMSEKERVFAKFQRLQDDVATIYRQIACFNFELDIHKWVNDTGSITPEKLAEFHNKNMARYLGPAVKLEENDGYFYVQWSHLRNFFYVFTYAYGQIISRGMYSAYKDDSNFIKKIIKFLSAGGSMSPDDIFKSIGIDATKPEFFLKGLKQIDVEIAELEKAARKLGLIK